MDRRNKAYSATYNRAFAFKSSAKDRLRQGCCLELAMRWARRFERQMVCKPACGDQRANGVAHSVVRESVYVEHVCLWGEALVKEASRCWLAGILT